MSGAGRVSAGGQKFDGLDAFRMIAAVMVVAIHTSPLSTYNDTMDFFLTRVICRLAVPFFFMIAGQFLLSDIVFAGVRQYKRIGRYLKKLLLLYGLSVLLYLPLGIYAGHYRNLTAFSVFRMLVFDGTFYHLWYFPACIVGVLLICLLRRYLTPRAVGITAAVLYFAGLMGDSYYGVTSKVPFLDALYQQGFEIFSYTRNGIFMAPLFLMLGAWAGHHDTRRSNRKNALYFVIFLCLMTVEGFDLRYLQFQRHDSMYLALPGCSLFLYRMLMGWQPCVKKWWRTVKLLRELCLWIYILHPAMIVVVRGFAKLTDSSEILVENSLAHFIAVTVLSIMVSFVFALLQLWFTSKDVNKGIGKKTGKCVGKGFAKKSGKRVAKGFAKETGKRIGKDQAFVEDGEEHYQRGRAWIELDREALRHNVEALQKQLPRGCELMPAVKANAYGHGALQIAGELNHMGIRAFCVACIDEGIALRKGGIEGEILILGYTHPEQAALLCRYRLTQTVVDYAYACSLNAYGKPISVHLAIDTGMHRLGEDCGNIEQLCKIFQMEHLKVEGAYTHLCAADSMEPGEQSFTRKQAESFYRVIAGLRERGCFCQKLHIQSSYSVLHYPKLAEDYARTGIALYGVLSEKKDCDSMKTELKPVLSLKARVAAVKDISKGDRVGYGQAFIADKDRKTATLTIGYGDGLPRCLSCGVGSVLLQGHKAKIIGRICMDQTIVDITGIPDVKPGDEAVLIGASGGEEISVYDLASECGTITNEILSRLGARLERIVI